MLENVWNRCSAKCRINLWYCQITNIILYRRLFILENIGRKKYIHKLWSHIYLPLKIQFWFVECGEHSTLEYWKSVEGCQNIFPVNKFRCKSPTDRQIGKKSILFSFCTTIVNNFYGSCKLKKQKISKILFSEMYCKQYYLACFYDQTILIKASIIRVHLRLKFAVVHFISSCSALTNEL